MNNTTHFYDNGFRFDVYEFDHHGVRYSVTSRRVATFQHCVEEVYVGEFRAKQGTPAWNTGVEGFRFMQGLYISA